MPVTPTYPGVYVQEISSGVRTITGVATAITAFMGRAPRGPVDEPVTINSFGDYERIFGGLWLDSPMSYAVRDFYLNGGGQALIVRLFKPADSPPKNGQEGAQEGASGVAESDKKAVPDGKARLTVDSLTLVAANPGVWGNDLRAAVDYDGISDDVAQRYGLKEEQLFNLVVTYRGVTERFANVSCAESSRRIDRVLSQSSQLVRLAGDVPTTRPRETKDTDGKPLPADQLPHGSGGAESAALASAGDYLGTQSDKTGLYALEKADLFTLLCIPPDARDGNTPVGVYQAAMAYCVRRRAMLIVDPPAGWTSLATVHLDDLGLTGEQARNAAVYFPRVLQADPLREGQLDAFVPCGIVAGVMSRTDTQRGIWKAPAGVDAAVQGVQGLAVSMTDAENGTLNPLGINCLRAFPVVGRVLWGARTLRGADQLADEYKYIPVRRLALYIEESLYRGTQWVVFEPNDEPLWAQVRLNVGAFTQHLFRQGAFQGRTPREAYFVKCDRETNPQNDIDRGIVNLVVGFAPLKPAEFVIISLQQMAGQIQA